MLVGRSEKQRRWKTRRWKEDAGTKGERWKKREREKETARGDRERQGEGKRTRWEIYTRNGSDEKVRTRLMFAARCIAETVLFTVNFDCSSSRRETVAPNEKTLPSITEARGADQLFASTMTTLDTRTTPRIVTLTRVSQPALFLSDDPLTYLEPGAPGVYHPFASRYFAKLTGIPAPFYRKKCRGRASNYASREKWPSLLNMSRAAVAGGGKGRPMHFPMDPDPSLLIRSSNPTWRQRSQSQPFQPLFTRFSLDRYF